MLADRMRLKRPVPAYTSHVMVAGYNGDSKYPAYGFQYAVFGSFTPGTSKGVLVNQLSHSFGVLGFQINASVPQSFFTKLEIWSGGTLLRTLTMATASYTANVSGTRWHISDTNLFTAGATYQIRVYP